LKFGIHCCGFSAPVFSNIGPDMTIKTGVDLAAIEKPGQVFQGMYFPLLQISRVDDSFPVFVGEAGSANKNIHKALSSLERLPRGKR
jgi:hypothetical protein